MRRSTILVTSLAALSIVAVAVPAVGSTSDLQQANFTVYEVSERISLVDNDTRELGPPGPPVPEVPSDGPEVGDVIILESGLYADASFRERTDPPMQFPGAPQWDGQPWGTFDEAGDRIGEVLGDCRFVRRVDDRERLPGPFPGAPGTIVPDPSLEDRLGSCVLTLRLPGGDIVAGGLLDITALEAAERVPLAITGGTGTYRRAVGTITLEQPSVYAFDRFRIDVSYRN